MIDFAYAYWVDDKIGFRRVLGVAFGVQDTNGQLYDGVITPKAARDLGEQLLAVAEAHGN